MARKVYRVIPIDSHTWCIEERRLNQQCLLYLLEGGQSAMLIDTGYGFGDLGAVVSGLTKRPVFVVNTHAHMDHIGADHQFPDSYLHEAEREIFALHTDPAEVRRMVDERIPPLLKPLLRGFREDITTQTIAGARHWFSCPQTFDLGGREVEVLLTPGHTPGSICLLDKANRYLFSGDTVCDWGVLLHMKGSLSPEIYRQSLERLWGIRGRFDAIYPGHHGLPLSPQRIADYIRCAEGLLDGSLIPAQVDGHREYRWKDIRITL